MSATTPVIATSTFERHRSASVERRRSAEAETYRKTEELIEKLNETITELQTENASLKSRVETVESDRRKQKAADDFLISSLHNRLCSIQARTASLETKNQDLERSLSIAENHIKSFREMIHDLSRRR